MGLLCSCLERKRKSARTTGSDCADDDSETHDLFFDLRTLQIATNFFSDLNQLGHGGFGPVYRGLIPNGQEVAVKKLSLNSRQGLREFTNEEWQGVFSTCTKKPLKESFIETSKSNILLDEHLNPKISDFGLARLFPGEDTHLNTFRISGTHGYMAPEYALHGYLSVKSDVFSYGVLVLEIVSGRKNHDTHLGGEKADILSYTWRLYQGGKTLDLVDPSLAKCNRDEAAMCIQLGLLCCQQSVSDRPDMNSVHLMLVSDSFTLPIPGKPGIQGRRGHWTTTGTSAFTNTNNNTNTNTNSNPSSTSTGIARVSGGNSFVEEYSRNSMSVSSIDEGR
ncbi:hypothetical protein GH714_025680 [Hevea brasiliensis]|uniref:Protein kinase domain-containing protein n=1 Tax=Hevea brasiliensis TaxID=3981 RepID=A0A6A6LBB3_HEVBR|nr:hypothetical protein GH714_025680 [Hevea brasiliensis]